MGDISVTMDVSRDTFCYHRRQGSSCHFDTWVDRRTVAGCPPHMNASVIYRHACIHICIHPCIHVYLHTSVHTQMHACIHRYIHTQFAHACRQTHECVCVHAFRSQHRASKARAAAQREGPRCMLACVFRGHSGHASTRGSRGRMYACIHTQGRARSACVRKFPVLRESLRRVCGHAGHTPEAERNTAMMSATSRQHHRTAAFITISGNVAFRVRAGLPLSLSAVRG